MLCALASENDPLQHNANGLRARCHGDPSHHWEQLLAGLTLKFFIDILYNGIEQYGMSPRCDSRFFRFIFITWTSALPARTSVHHMCA